MADESSISTSKVTTTHDAWQLPTRTEPEPTLKVYNSLTRTKVDFVTKRPGIVTWYNCGPTVYDASHMGHARNYLTQDIMRRILRDYFGYEVQFVMNITDVDDKIIVRGRHSYLLSEYLKSHPTITPDVLLDIQSAWSAYVFKSLSPALPSSTQPPTFDSAKSLWEDVLSKEKNDLKWSEEQQAREEKWSMYVATVKNGLESIQASEKQGTVGSEENLKTLVEGNKDALGAWLDKQYGATVTDPKIFRDLAAYWETSFFSSMSSLHVERPTTLTRVSEYIPEIVTFVEGIVARGLAYEGGGSVWFDTAKFEGAEGVEGEEWKHTYAKLQPWSKGNRELLEDGEGSLTTTTGKRSASDFALWKNSKPGEPRWVSPWGPGRPGWHIECSVMASAVLGEGMDVHSGGVDLAFPHHDNEIAQSEAYHNCRQWVNYFLHTGHLHIKGLKMSKSLKNFITIDQALADYSARQLRYAFLCQTWNAKLDFKDSLMEQVRSSESILNNFFANANALITEAKFTEGDSDEKHHYNSAEHELIAKLSKAQGDFRVALCDSFDTPKALQHLIELVSATNIYLSRGRAETNVGVVAAVAEWVTRMLRMFGLGEGSPTDSKGERVVSWGVPGQETAADRETVLMPYLRAMSNFRDQVRGLAKGGASAADILKLCDQLRDVDMVDLGVALDDQEDGRAKVKLVAPETLRQVRDEKAAAATEKLARQAEKAAKAEADRLAKLEKGRVPPTELFRQGGEYSEWDEKGMPTKDKDGVEVSKSQQKNLKKKWEQQAKLHDEFLKATTKG